jgi:hypothetical protein
MNIKCTNCQKEFNLSFLFDYKYFVCSSCYVIHNNIINTARFDKIPNRFDKIPTLEIGAKGLLKGDEFIVVNASFFENKTHENWIEYKLISASNKTIYLTEEKGHWTLEEKIEVGKVKKFPRLESLTYQNYSLKQYDNGNAKLTYCFGFFDYKPESYSVSYTEYINPPYFITVEKESNKTEYSFGEYISSKKIKKIFNLDEMPKKEGFGSAQPFYYNLDQVFIIFAIAMALVVAIHMFFYFAAKEQQVYEETFNLDEINNTEFYSQEFELDGPIAPLTVYVNSNMDNSWVSADFALININTNETVYFSKDLEYYYGYSEGESWTEGSKDEKFNICRVAKGRYKIMFQASKDELDSFNNSIRFSVYWGRASNWNLYFVLFVFIGIGGAIYFVKNSFESNRWEGSFFAMFKD